MPFNLTDLIIESVVRDGLTAIRRTPKLVDDIFSQLQEPWLVKKYGDREINKLKQFFSGGKEVSIVHSFGQVPSNLPCVSILLLDNPEDQPKAALEDFEDDVQTPFTEPEDLARQIIASNVTIFSYDPKSGLAECPDSADLSQVRIGNLFQDASGKRFPIKGGVQNGSGEKQFFLEPGLSLDLSKPGQIMSRIGFHQYTKRGIRETERLILGVHTTEPLLTKYLYTFLKHTIESRKMDLASRGLQEPTFQGSDFSRNLEYPGDQVASRFLTISGFVQNTWTDEEVIPIDDANVTVTVPMDQATTSQANLTGMTVQIQDTPPDPQD